MNNNEKIKTIIVALATIIIVKRLEIAAFGFWK